MGGVGDFGCWVADNWVDLGNFLFAGAVAWAAIVGNRLNQRLVNAELDPAIAVYIEADRTHHLSCALVIKNVGRGAARNIAVTVDPDVPIDTDDPDSRLSRLAMFEQGVTYLGPLQEIRTFYASYVQAEK